MQEHGVSKIVSVKFHKNADAAPSPANATATATATASASALVPPPPGPTLEDLGNTTHQVAPAEPAPAENAEPVAQER